MLIVVRVNGRTPSCNRSAASGALACGGVAAGKRDAHLVLVSGIERLAPVDHPTLGLDLPDTRGRGNLPRQPCADREPAARGA